MNKEQFRGGWLKQPVDDRDYTFKTVIAPTQLPSAVDRSTDVPTVLDQGQLGSCTANAIATAIMQCQTRQLRSKWIPSRLFIYYGERDIIGTVNEDSGAYIRDGFKVINRLGAPGEIFWPYIISRFSQKPTVEAYSRALLNQALLYYSLPGSVISIKTALAAGYYVVFGFTVFDSFFKISKKNPRMPMPNPKGETIAGGHAVTIVGYSNKRRAFLVRNSWGESWGDNGNYWMPYAFFELNNGAYVSDFWVLETLE